MPHLNGDKSSTYILNSKELKNCIVCLEINAMQCREGGPNGWILHGESLLPTGLPHPVFCCSVFIIAFLNQETMATHSLFAKTSLRSYFLLQVSWHRYKKNPANEAFLLSSKVLIFKMCYFCKEIMEFYIHVIQGSMGVLRYCSGS